MTVNLVWNENWSQWVVEPEINGDNLAKGGHASVSATAAVVVGGLSALDKPGPTTCAYTQTMYL